MDQPQGDNQDGQKRLDQSPPPTWWFQYLHPTPNPRSISSGVPIENHGSAIAIPLVVLFLIVAGGVFWITSSEQYVDRAMAEAREKAANRGQLEAFENVEDMTRNALRNPAVRAWVSVQTGWVALRSFLLFVVLTGLVLSILTGQWKSSVPFASVVCASTSIVSCGVLLYAVFRYLFAGELVFLAPVQLLASFDHTNPLHLLSARTDLFLLWFFAVASIRASALYRETRLIVVAVFVSSWLALFSIFFLLEEPFYFTP